MILLLMVLLPAWGLRAQTPFITTWKTNNPGTSGNKSITIPIHAAGTYLYDVDWNNDGTYDEFGITGSVTHTYGTAGTKTIRIRGTFPRIEFSNGGDRLKILSVDQWGDIVWGGMANAFYGCSNLHINASDSPNLSMVNSMANMFREATAFNENINSWNVSNVDDMQGVFWSAASFNQPLSGWNVGNVTNMNKMFYDAASFNQPIGGWDVSKVANMTSMFTNAASFNQAIGGWDVGEVLEMNKMFEGAVLFNQPIGSWDVSKVWDMGAMFNAAASFNQPIGSWNVSNVEIMVSMFEQASSFNRSLSGWDVGNVTDMTKLFHHATAFNQQLGGWDVTNVTNMYSMLVGSGLSSANYDNLLVGWSGQALKSNVPFGAGNIMYSCAFQTVHDLLTDPLGFNWDITDGGLDPTTLSLFYFDGDGDGYGAGEPVTACSAPSPDYVTENGDINDNDPAVNPHPDCSLSNRTWTGYLNQDWNASANWSPNCVPTAANVILIPNVANHPVIGNASTAFSKSITIEVGATMEILNGAALTVSGSGAAGILNQGTLQIGGQLEIANTTSNLLQNEGTVTNESTGVLLIHDTPEYAITFWPAGSVFYNYGSIDIYSIVGDGISTEAGSFFNYASVSIGLNGGAGNMRNVGIWVTGTFENESAGQIEIRNVIFDGIVNLFGTFTNKGTIRIDHVLRHGINSYGTCTNEGALLIGIGGDADNIGGNGLDHNSGVFTNTGTLAITETMLKAIDNTAAFYNLGLLKGTGNINCGGSGLSGTLAPGLSPGILTFTSDQVFEAGNTFEIEVDGIAPGTGHDLVEVNGTASVSGTLSASFGYTPADGDRIIFLTANVVSGTFATVSPALPEGWSVDYSVPGEVALVYAVPLPVELVEFSAVKQDGRVALQWQTASETNNRGFEIERAPDGKSWETLGFVTGYGTSTDKHAYHFIDENPAGGINYYRLRQIDFDGGTDFSEIRTVAFGKTPETIRVFPNPASEQATVQLPAGFENAGLELADAQGRMIFEEKDLAHSSDYRLDLTAFPSGLYFLRIQHNGIVSTQKLQINRD
ncbi:MAG TPA: BspA family leucine-rich repeat surface protein [Flavilitoribacter sp.]|nr:BspA family leucine-rich repeat surface protein [Flavilitoribacter sp.]